MEACSCSGVELLVTTVPEADPVTLWFDFELLASSAAAETPACADARVGLQASGSESTCSVLRLGSEVQVMLLLTGAETLNPEIPQRKSRQIFKLHGNIAPKYLEAQINPQLHISMKTDNLFFGLGSFIFTLRQKIKVGLVVNECHMRDTILYLMMKQSVLHHHTSFTMKQNKNYFLKPYIFSVKVKCLNSSVGVNSLNIVTAG